MIRERQLAISLFSIGLIGLGTLSAIYRDFAFDWQPVPAFHPGRGVLAVACGLFMMAASVGLLFRGTAAIAIRAIFLFLLAWLCLKIPAVIAVPRIEGVWIGLGEIGMLLAGGWVLFARLSGLENAAFFRHITGTKGVRIAQIIFGLAVLPVGLGHIAYVEITATLVPSWMPFRTGLAYLTGFGQITCGLAMLFSIMPRAAALIETDAGFVCLPGLGARYLDNRNAEAGWDATRSAVSSDCVPYHMGHRRFRFAGRRQ